MSLTACNMPDFNVLGVHEGSHEADIHEEESVDMTSESEDSGEEDISSDTTSDYSSSDDMEDADHQHTGFNHDTGSMSANPWPDRQSDLLPESIDTYNHYDSAELNNNSQNVQQVCFNMPNLPTEGLYALNPDGSPVIDAKSSADSEPRSFTNIPNFSNINSDAMNANNDSRSNEGAEKHVVSVSEQFIPKLEGITERFGNLFTIDHSEMNKSRTNTRCSAKTFRSRRNRTNSKQ